MIQTDPIKRANKSARSSGAVGRFPLCYRALRDIMLDGTDAEVLDFGAGPAAAHTKSLREDGYQVTAYDFGDNITDEIDTDALARSYEVVVASNVLNVQEPELLPVTLDQLYDAVKPAGCLIWNYPTSPRYSELTTREMLQKVMSLGFISATLIAGTRSAPVYLCWKI
jgi:hypothetical protein|tara:strand:+ start:4544 stop:5047 length:504 start_codon:yes stop_codon:yes gene_type:complete